MTTLTWIFILAVALAAVSQFAKPPVEKGKPPVEKACCERHRPMLDPNIEDVIYCPARDR